MSQHKLNPFARGTTTVLPEQIKDAFGRVLGEGDHVLLTLPKPPLFRVQKIAPVFDPTLPPNLMDITVQCTLRFRAARDEAIEEFVRVLTAAEAPAQPSKPAREEIRDEPDDPPTEPPPAPDPTDVEVRS